MAFPQGKILPVFKYNALICTGSMDDMKVPLPMLLPQSTLPKSQQVLCTFNKNSWEAACEHVQQNTHDLEPCQSQNHGTMELGGTYKATESKLC